MNRQIKCFLDINKPLNDFIVANLDTIDDFRIISDNKKFEGMIAFKDKKSFGFSLELLTENNLNIKCYNNSKLFWNKTIKTWEIKHWFILNFLDFLKQNNKQMDLKIFFDEM